MITKEQLNAVIMKMTPDQLIGFIKSLWESDKYTYIAYDERWWEKYCKIYKKVRRDDWKPYNELKWYDKMFTNEGEVDRDWETNIIFSSYSVEWYERPLREWIMHLFELWALDNIKIEYVQSYLAYYIPKQTLSS